MTAVLLVLTAPVLLVGLAWVLVAVRTQCGGCVGRSRYRWLRAPQFVDR